MRRPIFIALLLLAAVAAVFPRHTPAPLPPRPDDGVFRTVILGDSVARGAGDERQLGIGGFLRGMDVVNLGVNGARTANVQAVLKGSVARSAVLGADVVILSIGGNDLYGDSRSKLLSRVIPYLQQRRALAHLEEIVETLRRLNPAARVYILGLYNPYRHTNLRAWLDRQVNLWDARLIARFADTPAVTVVRICDLLDSDDRISTLDHFHPGAAGYRAIAERVAASIER